MTIGELFVNLGIKGTDKSQKALQGVKGTLGEVSTAGLAAKASILAVVYGIEQLASGSNAAGASLMSYAGATGLSAETLQRWQYAARQANVSANEMENSITGLQSSMIKMAMGQGMPSGFGVIKNAVGIDPDKIRDTMYMMDKLAEYAKTEGNVDFANEQLKSFGLSLDMISAMRRNAFNPTTLGQAPLYSDREAAVLAKMHAGWGNWEQQLEMGVGHLNAKFGGKFLQGLSGTTKELFKLVNAFAALAEKANLLGVVGDVFKGWGDIFGVISEGVDKLNEFADKQSEEKGKGWHGLVDKATDYVYGATGEGAAMKRYRELRDNVHKTYGVKGATSQTVINNHNTNVTAHVNEAQDGQDTAQHLKRVIDRTGRNRHGQKRAN